MQITSAKREQEIAQRSTEKDKIVCDLTTQNDCLNEKVTHLQSNIFRKQEHICHLERDREQSLKTLNTLSATVRKFEQQLELARVELNVFKGQLNDRERTLSATEDLVKRQNERLMKLEHVEQDLKVELVVRDLVNDLIDRIEEEDPKKCIDTINASSNESGNNQQMVNILNF